MKQEKRKREKIYISALLNDFFAVSSDSCQDEMIDQMDLPIAANCGSFIFHTM